MFFDSQVGEYVPPSSMPYTSSPQNEQSVDPLGSTSVAEHTLHSPLSVACVFGPFKLSTLTLRVTISATGFF